MGGGGGGGSRPVCGDVMYFLVQCERDSTGSSVNKGGGDGMGTGYG